MTDFKKAILITYPVEQAMKEAKPTAADIPKFTYASRKVDVVYPGDYTGLPQ